MRDSQTRQPLDQSAVRELCDVYLTTSRTYTLMADCCRQHVQMLQTVPLVTQETNRIPFLMQRADTLDTKARQSQEHYELSFIRLSGEYVPDETEGPRRDRQPESAPLVRADHTPKAPTRGMEELERLWALQDQRATTVAALQQARKRAWGCRDYDGFSEVMKLYLRSLSVNTLAELADIETQADACPSPR